MIPLLGWLPWLARDASDEFQATLGAEAFTDEAQAERAVADEREDPSTPSARPQVYPVRDLEPQAAEVKYPNGLIKRTRYPRVDLSERMVVIAYHQAGVERSEARWGRSAHRVTCHREIGPTGTRYRVHPLNVRLVATNRLDRAPWHAICIEVLGNFERVEGTGSWYKPDRFGRGVLGAAQATALRQESAAIIREVRELGGEVLGVVPHIVAGRNAKGVPNRQACCGSAIWKVAESVAWKHGLRVPAPKWKIGGLPVPNEWRSKHWPHMKRFFT